MLDIKNIKKISNLTHKEWNKISHSYVDFSKNKKFNKKVALQDLIDIKRIFYEEEINFWIIGGTLLGWVRDNDFISWDDDVDIAVYEEDILKKYKILKDKFMFNGFIFRDAEKEMGTKINLYRHKQKNSIDCLFLNSKYGNGKYRFSRIRKHPRKYFENYGTIKFKGITFRVPSPPEKYLSHMYKNWETPIKSSRPQKEWRNKKIYWKK